MNYVSVEELLHYVATLLAELKAKSLFMTISMHNIVGTNIVCFVTGKLS